MNLARIEVLEFGGAGLGDFDVGNERKDDVCRVSLLYMGLDAEGICGVDKDAGVLGSNDRFDDRSQVVDFGEGLDAENHIVVGAFARRGFFGGSNDWMK